jgi:phage tail sheath gpL-like
MPITAPSGGTQATYTITAFVSNTNPSKASSVQIWVCSQQLGTVGFTTTDTASTIGAAIAAQLLAQSNIPISNAVNASGVVTVTYFHKGTTGEDFPVRAVPAATGTGVNLSPAQLLFATNATGAGSVVISLGAVSITAALAGGETPAQVATKVAAAVNASSYPVTAVVDGTTPAQVDLYYNANNGGWDVRRISASIVTTTGLTVNAGSGATSGTGSPTSFSFNGTQGTGLPSLGTAITNLTNQQPWYRSWMVPWTDATSLGTIATYIEAAKNGSITGQKLQVLTVCDFQSLTVDGAIPAAVTPNLTTSNPNYAFGWSPDCPTQAFELSARIAAARAAFWISAPQKNWNGYRITGNPSAPILLPPTTPSLDQQNTALRTYGLAPWVRGASGNLEVVKGRTTSLANDMRLWSWSCEAQASYHWQDLQSYFAQVFQGGSLVQHGPPKAAGLFDDQSFIDTTIARLKLWEQQGNYDGADALASTVKASRDPQNINRENVTYAESPVLDLDQVVFTGLFQQAAA